MATISIAQKKRERLNEWKGWIKGFLELNSVNPLPTYKTISHAAELLNDYYWRMAYGYIKPLLNSSKDNIHYYKIISVSELAVVAVQPFVFTKAGTPEQRREINADFAFFVACNIFLTWKIDKKTIVDFESVKALMSYQEVIDIQRKGGKSNKKKYPVTFREEHIDWLKTLNPAAPLPVLSNSHTWRMCLFAARALALTKSKKLTD